MDFVPHFNITMLYLFHKYNFNYEVYNKKQVNEFEVSYNKNNPSGRVSIFKSWEDFFNRKYIPFTTFADIIDLIDFDDVTIKIENKSTNILL